VFISLLVAALLVKGAKESATVNLGLVAIKLIALAVFIGIALFAFNGENFSPFAPHGFGNPLDFSTDADGKRYGVAAAAAIIFFAFYGFDAVSTSAEEAKNPGRDLTIGILGSMVLCTLLYMVVGAAAIGAWPYTEFANSDWPLSQIMENLGHPLAASLIAGAAIVALPSVILVMMYGQTRVFFVMSRDGLLPHSLSKVNPRTGVPTGVTLVIGGAIALISGLFELGDIASVANAGTLAAFIAVAASVMILRRTHPELPRLFKVPAVTLIAPLAILGCLYLFLSLKLMTIAVFFAWNALGLLIYTLYSRPRSHARTKA
jgi:basic amino acid/polyamine antiporter, APA family